MARNRVPIGTAHIIGGGLNQNGQPAPSERLVDVLDDDVWIGSDDPLIDVIGRLIGRPSATLPRPRYDSLQRPGQFDLTQYTGHEPYVLTIPMKFDGHGTSVEARIRDLERLAERSGPNLEPPVVKVLGNGVPHTSLRWRVQSLDEIEDRTRYTTTGDRWRFCVTVTLIQRVTDQVLAESLKAVLPAKRSRGVVNRSTRVKAGEDSVYDVARRVYGDPSRASDIARANPGIRLGSKLRVGLRLRLL